MSDDKIRTIQNWPELKNFKNIQSFLSFVSQIIMITMMIKINTDDKE